MIRILLALAIGIIGFQLNLNATTTIIPDGGMINDPLLAGDTVIVEAGSTVTAAGFAFQGVIINHGTINVSTGVNIQMTGTLINVGIFNVNPGAIVIDNGTLINSVGGTINQLGMGVVNGTGDLVNCGSISLTFTSMATMNIPLNTPCNDGDNSTFNDVITVAGDCNSCAGASQCDPGQFSASGLMPCTDCAAGTFQSNFGAQSCEQCIPGRFQDQNGQTSCKVCPAGTYNDVTGASSCKTCPAGTSSPQGSTSLSSCIPVAAVPTLSQWGMIILALSLCIVGVIHFNKSIFGLYK